MKRVIHVLLRIALVLVLLVLVLASLLQTSWGREFLASTLSRMASRSGNIEVKIGQIQGWVPMDMRVDCVVIGDQDGEWLILRDLHARWVLQDLLHGRIRLTRLGAREVEWTRFPKLSESPEKRQRTKDDWIGGAEVVLEGWSIDRLLLGPSLAGMPLEYTVRSGGMVLVEGRLYGDLVIHGDAEGTVDFNADFLDGTNRTMELRAELQQMNRPTFGMDRLSGSLTATLDARGVDASIEANIESDETSGHVSSRLQYAARHLHVEEFRFEGSGYAADADLELSFSRGRIGADIDASLTDMHALSYQLSGSAEVITSNKTWLVQVPRMSLRAWDTIAFSLAGSFSPREVDLKADLAEFDLGLLPHAMASNFTGQVAGTASVSGTPDSPAVDVALGVTGFTSSAETLDELPSLDYRVSVSVSDGRLDAVTMITNSVSGYLEADARMPCTLSIVPFDFAIEPGLLGGSVDAFLDLDVFNGLSMLENQHISGLLSAELDVKEGVPSGVVYLEDGAYEHYSWGVLFRDFQATLEASSEGLAVHHATATDGGSGRLVLSGGLSGGVLDLSIDLQQARMIRRPELEATISGGLDITGPYTRPEIGGRLVVDRADLLPDNIMPSKPPLLEDYDAGVQVRSDVRTDQHEPYPIGLNVMLDFSDQVYINASLIDSVWGGSLHLRDSENGLWIKGGIRPRRGYVSFIGKKFRLQDGSVDMDSAVYPIPVMNNLTAEYSRSDITARLVLNGSVVNPQYRLESSPPLPEDEILSQVLFKRDVSSISPYQAVQIAMAARQLSGGLSGPGFLYQFRQAVGVDTLEWREPDSVDDKSSVAAGKYITPDLYVEVSSTFGTDPQTDMTAEYEINRHFSVETSTGPELRPGIGLNWKNDY